jgi:hypothetical protein
MAPTTTQPRRRDRGKDEAWICAFLDRAVWGTLAVPASEGAAPHVNTNLFVRIGDALYLHTGAHGALVDAVRAGGDGGIPATFTTGVFGRLLPAPEALEFSIEYAAVVVQGRLSWLEDAAEATDVLHRLLERYAPQLERGRDYGAVTPEEFKRTAVFRLDVERWSGKEKAVGSHPGAFALTEPGVPFEMG